MKVVQSSSFFIRKDFKCPRIKKTEHTLSKTSTFFTNIDVAQNKPKKKMDPFLEGMAELE
jgi:hypothetical protein